MLWALVLPAVFGRLGVRRFRAGLRGGAEVRAEAREPVFGYGAHGADWLDGSCPSRTAQSPINLLGATATQPAAGFFEVAYEPAAAARLENTGVKLSASGMKGGLVFQGDLYELEELVVHAPSEHTINGRRAALELQLQHGRSGSARKVILSVLADAPGAASFLQQPQPALGDLDAGQERVMVDMSQAEEEDEPLNPVEAEFEEVQRLEKASEHLPPHSFARRASASNFTFAPPSPLDPGYAQGLSGLFSQELPLPEAVAEADLTNATWDLSSLVPEGATYVTYAGSLTVPPCTENVQWLVASKVVPASADQIQRLTNAMKRVEPRGNWRVVMPFNQRFTKVLAAQHRKSLLATTPPPDAKAPDPRKLAAWSQAEDAVVIADYTNRYTRDIDQALRTSALAHYRGYIDPLPTTTTPAPPPPTQFPVPKIWLDPHKREQALHSAAANGVAAVVQGMVDAAVSGIKIAASLGNSDVYEELPH